MRTSLAGAWERVSSSYWFAPALLAAAGSGLAVGMLWLDVSGSEGIRDALPWAYGGGASGAREILGSVASSMMTVLSVSFSVTIVALTVASQQFGPRVLHNFIRKPGPQVVLGSFIGTFLYSLIVLRSVRSEPPEFVPHLSVTVSVFLVGCSIASLIYFIHHVSASIQAANILAEIAGEIDASVRRLFPERLAQGEEDGQGEGAAVDRGPSALDGPEAGRVQAPASGYVQDIDDGRVMEVATSCDVVVRLERRPGDFVVDGQALATVVPIGQLNTEARRRLQHAFLLGPRRTPSRDVAFGLSQLLEIALHALSPAVNEPFLAVNCIDRLLQALSHLAERGIPSSRREDDAGRLRVVANPFTFRVAADYVFGALLVPASASPLTAVRLLEGVAALAPHLRREEDVEALARYAAVLHREAGEQARIEDVRFRIHGAHDRAARALRDARHPPPA